VISGSEDANVRLWKAEPSRKLGVMGEREKNVVDYRQKLIDKFKYSK
jgi:DDB1- and CUL4-associated factor 13